MFHTIQNLILALLILACGLLSSCSRFGDDEFKSNNPAISDTSLTLDFSGEVNTTSFKSIVFTNNTSNEFYQIFNLAKTGDTCSAFSLFNITTLEDEVLYDAKESTQEVLSEQTYSINVAVAPGDSVKINIEFSPLPCELKSYSPHLIVYYSDSSETLSQTITLNAKVEDNSTSNTCGDIHQISDLSELVGEEPSRVLPELSEGQYYGLVPYAIRGYIQPTEGYASLAAEIYAYFDNPAVDEPGYLAPYLPLEYKEDGVYKFLHIDECRGFYFPTSRTDAYFLSALQVLTTNQDYDLFIETKDEDKLGSAHVDNLVLQIDANINNSGSIIQSEDGNFSIQIQTSLTTDYTETNYYLQNTVGKVLDADGNDILQIEENGNDSRMYGTPLRHGEMVLVGIGYFLPSNYNMSDEAISGLIDTPAYLFIQIHLRAVILNETDIPIASSKL